MRLGRIHYCDWTPELRALLKTADAFADLIAIDIEEVRPDPEADNERKSERNKRVATPQPKDEEEPATEKQGKPSRSDI